MSERRYLLVLAGICGFLGVLCLLAFAGRKSRSGETVETALLNGRYASRLSCVEVSRNGESLSLQRIEVGGRSLWLGGADFQQGEPGDPSTPPERLIFPVDAAVMGEFLSAMERVRDLTVVSRKQDGGTLAGFGLGDGEGCSFGFRLEDGAVVSRVTFGDSDYSGRRVYLKTPESPVYLARDEFYPWLSAGAKGWVDMALVPKTLLGISGEGQVQGIAFSAASENGALRQERLLPGQEGFLAKAGRLLSLRGGSLIAPFAAAGKKMLGEIALDTGLGSSVTLAVYEGKRSQAGNEAASYYLVPTIHPFGSAASPASPAFGTERSDPGFETRRLNYGFETRRLNYGFEISRWTWQSIQEIFQD